jgi:predicted PurR-regulated permease PerM
VPLVGDHLAATASGILTDPHGVFALIQEHQAQILKFAGAIAQEALSTIVVAIGALVGCYVFYRCGDPLTLQLSRVLERIGGDSIPPLLNAVQLTVRGAAYSVLATAVAQGLLSGLGFLVSGAPSPLLLTVLSMVVSLIPFGPPLVYVPVALYLILLSGQPWYYGAGLLVWGIGVVSTVDNLLRPLFISQATQVRPILVFIGVLGGLTAFGLLGVFIGPALIAVAQWLWLDFAQDKEPTESQEL